MLEIIQKHNIPQTGRAFFVGGSVRDYLMGRLPVDYDITVLRNPEKYAKQLAANTAGRLVEMGKPGKMIFRVVTGASIFDVSAANGASIEDDLKTRDFTINALAYCTKSGKLIDCSGGLADLAAQRIRMISNKVFEKDPVRLVRAFRLGAQLGFSIEPGTILYIKQDAARICCSAQERIKAEIFKMMASMQSHAYLELMAQSGLLQNIFPELAFLPGCRQNRHHDYDVFEHTLKAYAHLETILNSYAVFMRTIGEEIPSEINPIAAALLKCAILLHDIGKPSTRKVDQFGRIHFYGHSRESAEQALHIADRLKFSTREKRHIEFIIRNHLRPLFLFSAKCRRTLTPRGVTRFFMQCAENTPHLLLHAVADMKAKKSLASTQTDAFVAFAKNLIHDFHCNFKRRKATPALVTGHDLIQEFGLTPSPLFKTILDQIEEARLSGSIHNRSEALKVAADYLNRQMPCTNP